MEMLNLLKQIVVQIATPYSTGTGFYVKDFNLIVTNEHLVRNNKAVIVEGNTFEKELVSVVYTDAKYDLAFLESPKNHTLPAIHLSVEQADIGDQVIAIGHPFGLQFTTTQGIVSNILDETDFRYIQHDAALNPGNSGGPLLRLADKTIIGINTFVIKNGENIGFSLPISYIQRSWQAFLKGNGEVATRCYSCSNIVFESNLTSKYCPKCGVKLQLPTQAETYEPLGVAKTIESVLEQIGYDVQLSRRGPNNWDVHQGSARITISYYEKTGLISGDAYLCQLPTDNVKSLYEFMLKQNYIHYGLTFSIKPHGQDIVLSLLIYDKYFNIDTGVRLFRHLFERADHYDNILVEQYGASWKYEYSE